MEKFISLLKELTENKIIKCSIDKKFVGSYSINSLCKRFYNRISKSILKNYEDQADISHRPYYIINFYDTSPKLIKENNKKEIVSMITLKKPSPDAPLGVLEKGKNFEGNFSKDQFFLIHPKCSILHPMNPATKEKSKDYITRCLETNISSIIEIASVQNKLARSISNYGRVMLQNQQVNEEKKAILNRINELVKNKLLEENNNLPGIHQSIYNHFIQSIEFQERTFNTKSYLLNYT